MSDSSALQGVCREGSLLAAPVQPLSSSKHYILENQFSWAFISTKHFPVMVDNYLIYLGKWSPSL